MDKNTLNIMYAASLEFGPNWRKSLKELANEQLPELAEPELSEICVYISQVRADIEAIMLENYAGIIDGAIESGKVVNKIKTRYDWIDEKNISHGYSQGMYYAWRG